MSAQVRELLGDHAELRARSAAMANDPECWRCGHEIAVAAGEVANIVIERNPTTGDIIVHYAHSGCSSSQVVEGDASRSAMWEKATDLNFTAALRSARPRLAMLIESRNPFMLVAGGLDGVTQSLSSRGLVSVRAPLSAVTAPKLDNAWACWLDAGDLIIADGPGEILRYDGMSPEFIRALKHDRALLLLAAADFGLEAPDPARIDIVLATGGAVGGIVKYRD